MPVDWYASLSIAVDAGGLEQCPQSRAIFLPDGRAPVTRERGAEQRLHNPALVRTLRRLAEAGPRDFYAGEIARSIVADLAGGGCAIDAADLAGYQARLVAPATLDYRGTRLHAMPGLSGGPTYLAALAELAGTLASVQRLGPEAFAAYARAISDAYATRLETFGHAGTTNESCTSHVSVIDADGNMAALTNSLLSRFGAKVTLPGTGILMNNGMMWFDPRPGRPNAIAPGKRPLANMCPVVATRDGVPAFAMGAAGGRQIVPALVQLTSFLLDFGLSPEEAFHVPRLDASTRTVVCNARMPADQVARHRAAFPGRARRGHRLSGAVRGAERRAARRRAAPQHRHGACDDAVARRCRGGCRMSDLLTVRDLTVTIGDAPVVDRMNFTIRAGRDGRAGRRERLRQEPDGARHHGPAAAGRAPALPARSCSTGATSRRSTKPAWRRSAATSCR